MEPKSAAKPLSEKELMEIALEYNLRKAKEAKGVPNWKTEGDYMTELSRSAERILQAQERDKNGF